MPELPEVQTILDELKHMGIIGHTILQAHVYWFKTVAQPDVNTFLKMLPGKKILNLERRAKYLIFHLSDNLDLYIHLRMTGRLLWSSTQRPLDPPLLPYIRLSLDLDHNHQLHFHDTRKFGRWSLINNSELFLHKIGPEPLDSNFSADLFLDKLKKKQRALKPLLLDQHFLAGLGNIYVDEALWEAQLHPLRKAHSLSPEEGKKLHASIIQVLQRGIENQGTTLGVGRTNYYRLNGQRGQHQTLLKVFRRTGQACPRCGSVIERLVVAQRGTHICPQCQPL